MADVIRTVTFQTLTIDEAGRVVDERAGSIDEIVVDLGHGLTLSFATVPAGTIGVGSGRGQGNAEEQPQHTVRVASFLAGRCLVTQAQWQRVMGGRLPCRFKGETLPVENISWFEAQAFCRRLSHTIGRVCYLPRERQWEYACRAGTTGPFHFGATLSTDLANYCGEHRYRNEPAGPYRHTTTPVGRFAPNDFGLFDLHGNLWEWCADAWHEDYTGALGDGRSWTTRGDDHLRVIRGGSWHDVPGACRSAARAQFSPDGGDDLVGFRVFADIVPADESLGALKAG